MSPLFHFHKLNEKGIKKAENMSNQFDNFLGVLQVIIGKDNLDVREFHICKTKLEEACFFAKKCVAIQKENQI